SNCTNPQLRYGVTITGSTGATANVILNEGEAMGHNFVWTLPGEAGNVEGWLAEETASGMKEFPDFHALQIRDFLAAIREDREPAVTGEEGRKTVEIMEAMYRSGYKHAPVAFPVPVEDDTPRARNYRAGVPA